MTLSDQDAKRIYDDIENLKENAVTASKISYHAMIELERLHALVEVLRGLIDNLKDDARKTSVSFSRAGGDFKGKCYQVRSECVEKNIIPLREKVSGITTRVIIYGTVAAVGGTIVINIIVAFAFKMLSFNTGG